MMKSDFQNFLNVFSDSDVVKHLPWIFQRSLILDLQHNILAVNESVSSHLGYKAIDLVGRPVSVLLSDDEAGLRLKLYLAQGAFQDESAILIDASYRSVNVEISGFNLGLLSDLNSIIVLQVLMRDPAKVPDTPLDDFIYRAAHDLRGPVATIKGLVNLMGMNRVDDDTREIIRLLEFQANKLDERLFDLSYLAGTVREAKNVHPSLRSLYDIETELRNVIVNSAFLDGLHFGFHANTGTCDQSSLSAIKTLAINVLHFILSLPAITIPAEIVYRFTTVGDVLTLTVEFDGFHIDNDTATGMTGERLVYTDLVTYPQLLNYYCAQRIATELKAKLEFIKDPVHRFTIDIPVQD